MGVSVTLLLAFCTNTVIEFLLSTGSSFISSIGAGTIFRLGEQKLNDFSVGEAKIGEKQSRQSNSKYNFLQYVFFEKGIRSVQWGLGQSLRSWGTFENLCLKIDLTVCKVTFNCTRGVQKVLQLNMTHK